MFHRNSRKGFSLIKLLIVVAIILIVGSIAAPRLNRSGGHNPAVPAIASIRAIHSAETTYYSQFNKYATSLAELGPPASGSTSPSAAGLIDNALASGSKHGYRFTVAGNPSGYIVSAVPEKFNVNGSRTFYSDQSMVVHEHYGPEPATPQDPELK